MKNIKKLNLIYLGVVINYATKTYVINEINEEYKQSKGYIFKRITEEEYYNYIKK